MEHLDTSVLESLRVPAALRDDVGQVVALTDVFCDEHLGDEYRDVVRRLVAKLARKRPSPLLRGDLRVWAAAAIYAAGSLNFLFDRAQRPHLTGDDLANLTGVAKSTMANKANAIRDSLHTSQFDTEFCLPSRLAAHPSAWYIEMNGLIVDARTLPPNLLAEAHRRGLVPDPAVLEPAFAR